MIQVNCYTMCTILLTLHTYCGHKLLQPSTSIKYYSPYGGIDGDCSGDVHNDFTECEHLVT